MKDRTHFLFIFFSVLFKTALKEKKIAKTKVNLFFCVFIG